MRGDIAYRIYGVHEGRAKDSYFGAYRTRAEAEATIAELSAREMHGTNWAAKYHNRGFVIREVVVDVDFEIPSQPKPREKYFVKGTPRQNRPGTWDSTIVEVFRRTESPDHLEKICEYIRHYRLLQTFEPFRQGDREFALVSSDYTRTAVLDLASGQIIAEEPETAPRPGGGFCPVGFYVPDWWDVNDDSVIPGSEYWRDDYEWPTGNFGFVWGCCWGDDTSWKIQYLDLSRVGEGIIQRDERFGYVELATRGYDSPCLKTELPTDRRATRPPFITLHRHKGVTEISFDVEMTFDLDSGKPKEWQRLRIENFE